MHVRILLQFTGHDDSPGAAAEIAAFEKTVERPEDLGLSLAEGKALTAAIQKACRGSPGRVVGGASSLLRGLRCAPAQQGQLCPGRCTL